MEADLKEVKGEEPTGLAGELDTLAPRLPSSWPLFTLAIAVATDSQKSNCLSSLTHPLPSVLSATPTGTHVALMCAEHRYEGVKRQT